ncbi:MULTISPECIES: hypothetical protein [Chryseobacterium]|uniref:Anti-sigma factor n=1 Tax=Chryseobacterium camelliae TaxID=1265445 RepID=A0ABU0TNQ9_9FLAO|nr:MULTISPECIES: hypothetical protein [Chryseobacterium]MDT3408281.1 hypothetical protein [Pseudacidovorax intermedius]MDQ1097863.1 hypothetical protein [Chryseobacterium camelliae]MDQ1101798.1 hypothetical protein [Chryseobacterium sp. SORGH_AS_1048]MDR6085236.1 hypothetical protein [Chryseobacterium sp. SORGH_AS_0909]MDR6129594.1 hypothetical protein [Chryseobacterium sp. SORGH_AS_1175]
MSKDQFQDKYNEIFQSIKEEKMDWDFDDFLEKAEGTHQDDPGTPIITIGTKSKPSFPKWFWMAAALALLLGTGFVVSYLQKTDIDDRSKMVEHQIRQQKNTFIEENNEHQEQVAVNTVSDSVSGAKKDSVFQENSIAENDVMDKILSKRGRLKKEKKPKFVKNTTYYAPAKDSTGYNANYVIVNGKRIENVEEAINVTKYSFQVFANHVSKKLAQTKVVDDNY